MLKEKNESGTSRDGDVKVDCSGLLQQGKETGLSSKIPRRVRTAAREHCALILERF